MTEERIVYIFTELKKYLDDEQMHGIIAPYMFYIFEITDYKSDDLEKIFAQISVEGGKTIMSTAMRLREEGRQEGIYIGIEKGIQKGIEKERLNTRTTLSKNIKKMFLKGMSYEEIMDITELSRQEIDELRKL